MKETIRLWKKYLGWIDGQKEIVYQHGTKWSKSKTPDAAEFLTLVAEGKIK